MAFESIVVDLTQVLLSPLVIKFVLIGRITPLSKKDTLWATGIASASIFAALCLSDSLGHPVLEQVECHGEETLSFSQAVDLMGGSAGTKAL